MPAEEPRRVLARQQRGLAGPALREPRHPQRRVDADQRRGAGGDGGVGRRDRRAVQQPMQRREPRPQEGVDLRVPLAETDAIHEYEQDLLQTTPWQTTSPADSVLPRRYLRPRSTTPRGGARPGARGLGSLAPTDQKILPLSQGSPTGV